MPNEMNVNVDMLGIGGGSGPVAQHLISNGRLNLGSLRPYFKNDGKCYVNMYRGGDPTSPTSYVERPIQANATLRRDEWKQLDAAIMGISRERLGGIDNLISNGLTYNLGNALGTTVLEWHDVSEALEAEMTMDGVTRTKNDALNFQTNYLPIPIIHVDYEINTRMLEASRSLGNPLDTTLAERAARRVQEKLEDLLFTDTTYAWGTKDDRNRNKIYSYLNHPDRCTVNLSINWDASSITAALILQDVKEMVSALRAVHHYGPYMLYIPSAYQTVLDDDYSTSGASIMTIRDRLMKVDGLKGIQVVDHLTANNVIMAQMTSDVVRLVRGMGLQNVQWKEEGNFLTKFKVMTIQVPQIRSDQLGHCGICHMA
jgi:hypothetical protein